MRERARAAYCFLARPRARMYFAAPFAYVHGAPSHTRAMSKADVSVSNPAIHRMSPRERREAWEAVLFLSPWIIGFICFTAGPVLFSLGLSFFKWDAIHPARLHGLGNYRQMLHDPLLGKSLG